MTTLMAIFDTNSLIQSILFFTKYIICTYTDVISIVIAKLNLNGLDINRNYFNITYMHIQVCHYDYSNCYLRYSRYKIPK